MTTDDAFAFLHQTVAGCVDEVRAWEHGAVYSTPSLPLVYSLNAVEVSTGAPDAAAVLAEMPPGLPRPSVIVEGEERYLALDEAFAGWEAETELTMLLDPARLPGAPAADAVREGTVAEIDALAERWFAEEFLDQEGSEAVAQLVTYGRRQRAARETRAFVSPDADAMTLLWSDGVTAQVEDVYTVPEARNRGHARALVSHTTRLAAEEGHRTVFIVADQDDTPKELYARLGFTPAATARRFTAATPSRR